MLRTIPFIYNSSTFYKIEMGYKYAKFTLDDTVVCQIVTPYVDTDLMGIHHYQIGNTMWLVHESYPPQKITRESASLFAINEIVFNYGPFLTRNDLIDEIAEFPAYMIYSGGVTTNSLGNLKCCQADGTTEVSFFDELHVGALFKIITKRTKTTSAWKRTASTNIYVYDGVSYDEDTAGKTDEFLEASKIKVKGTYTFTTSNFLADTNEGTIVLERSENGSDWERVRSEISSTIYSSVEKANNVYYRSMVLSSDDGGIAPLGILKANITVTNTVVEGIVKVTEYIDASNVTVKVIGDLDETTGNDATKRWAEGAWSDYRGWPNSITFYEDRAVYGGMKAIAEQVTY